MNTDAEERRLLIALLREWYDLFSPCRKEGTQGANLIDRTGFMLNVVKMTTPNTTPSDPYLTCKKGAGGLR